MENILVDVRERDEFKAEHIPGSINLPLSELPSSSALLKHLQDKNIVLMCLSGKRCQIAKESIGRFDFKLPHLEVFEGGLQAWKAAGRPTVSKTTVSVPLVRQVMVAAGLLILIFNALAFWVAPAWIYGTAFMGAGLTVAGITGFCPMAELLGRMPWNR